MAAAPNDLPQSLCCFLGSRAVMQSFWISAEQLAQLSNELSSAFISPLPSFHVLKISGPDQQKFLQGQLTCDVATLTSERFLRGAQCDAKGKMWGTFHLLQAGEDLLWLAFRDELQASLAQLKKYGVFSKVSFTEAQQDYAVFGIGGEDSARLLSELGYPQLSPGDQASVEGGYLLALAADHFLLVLGIPAAQQLWQQQQARLAAPTRWLAQHIAHGIPYLEQPLINQYIPQQLNLQALDAISFSKGCYMGQEMVARTKYRGINKRAMYLLSAKTDQTPVAGSDIELQLGENWRRSGVVVNAVNIQGQLQLLAVLPNDIHAENQFRLAADPEIRLQLQPLPYELTN